MITQTNAPASSRSSPAQARRPPPCISARATPRRTLCASPARKPPPSAARFVRQPALRRSKPPTGVQPHCKTTRSAREVERKKRHFSRFCWCDKKAPLHEFTSRFHNGKVEISRRARRMVGELFGKQQKRPQQAAKPIGYGAHAAGRGGGRGGRGGDRGGRGGGRGPAAVRVTVRRLNHVLTRRPRRSARRRRRSPRWTCRSCKRCVR